MLMRSLFYVLSVEKSSAGTTTLLGTIEFMLRVKNHSLVQTVANPSIRRVTSRNIGTCTLEINRSAVVSVGRALYVRATFQVT